MKRVGYLYEKIMTLDNVLAAWELYNSRRPPYLRKLVDVAVAIRILERMKTDFRGVIGRPRIKYIRESGKVRRLQIPSFQSTIAQTAIWNVCGEFVERRIHSQSFSSRKGMGGHLAARKCEKFVHCHGMDKAKYCFYFDIKKYYQHIDKRLLMDRLSCVFKDKKVLELFRIVVYSSDDGLPIGYPFSHALANLFLVPLYYLMMSVRNVSKVYVYMDNWTVFSRYKKPLKVAKEFADRWLAGVGCSIKSDWQIFPTRCRGVKICGFVITSGRTRIYPRIWKRLRRNFDRYQKTPNMHLYLSLMSRLGWLKAINMQYNPIFQTKQGGYIWR